MTGADAAKTHACPGCGKPIPVQMFLCNLDSAATPDEVIVAVGTALDAGDDLTAARGLNEVYDTLRGP